MTALGTSLPLARASGYFVFWVEDDNKLCLEAVANQQDWPADVSPLEIRCSG